MAGVVPAPSPRVRVIDWLEGCSRDKCFWAGWIIVMLCSANNCVLLRFHADIQAIPTTKVCLAHLEGKGSCCIY